MRRCWHYIHTNIQKCWHTHTHTHTHKLNNNMWLTNLAVTSWQYLLAICNACCCSVRRTGRAAGATRGPVWATSGDSEPKGNIVVRTQNSTALQDKKGRKKSARGAIRYQLSSRSTCTKCRASQVYGEKSHQFIQTYHIMKERKNMLTELDEQNWLLSL